MFTTILLPFNGQITYNGRIFFFYKIQYARRGIREKFKKD